MLSMKPHWYFLTASMMRWSHFQEMLRCKKPVSSGQQSTVVLRLGAAGTGHPGEGTTRVGASPAAAKDGARPAGAVRAVAPVPPLHHGPRLQGLDYLCVSTPLQASAAPGPPELRSHCGEAT